MCVCGGGGGGGGGLRVLLEERYGTQRFADC